MYTTDQTCKRAEGREFPIPTSTPYRRVGVDTLCSFLTAYPRVVTLTALQTAGAFVCAHEYRAIRTVQAAQPL